MQSISSAPFKMSALHTVGSLYVLFLKLPLLLTFFERLKFSSEDCHHGYNTILFIGIDSYSLQHNYLDLYFSYAHGNPTIEKTDSEILSNLLKDSPQVRMCRLGVLMQWSIHYMTPCTLATPQHCARHFYQDLLEKTVLLAMRNLCCEDVTSYCPH